MIHGNRHVANQGFDCPKVLLVLQVGGNISDFVKLYGRELYPSALKLYDSRLVVGNPLVGTVKMYEPLGSTWKVATSWLAIVNTQFFKSQNHGFDVATFYVLSRCS